MEKGILMIEEALSREDHRADLVEAIESAKQDMRRHLGLDSDAESSASEPPAAVR